MKLLCESGNNIALLCVFCSRENVPDFILAVNICPYSAALLTVMRFIQAWGVYEMFLIWFVLAVAPVFQNSMHEYCDSVGIQLSSDRLVDRQA
jgi:hypothetical protein